MTRWRAILLVARRELIERGRSRAFILSLLLSQGLILGSFFLQSTIEGDINKVALGTVGPPSAELQVALNTTAGIIGADLQLTTFDDLGAARQAILDDEIDAVIVPPDVAPGDQGAGELLVRDRAGQRVQTIVQGAFAVLSNPDPIPLPSIRALAPSGPEDDSALLLANVGVVLLFVGIFTFGYWVLSGVVEEKQNRVVEVIVSTVQPRDLLMGKVLGIGALGLAQLVVFTVSGLIIGSATGRFELPPTGPTAVAMMLVWFVLGFTLYATAFAVLGALASRMEEASNVTTPVTMVAVLTYLVSLTVVTSQPDALLARVMTFLPPAAPIVVPLRAALNAIEPWEIVVAAILTIATIYALFAVGGRVYSGAALASGGRAKLRDAWRSGAR